MRALVRAGRYLWALPGTVLGLALAAASLARPMVRDGVLDAASRRGFCRLHRRMGFGAVTLGHVVVRSGSRGIAPGETLWRHELAHVGQWEALGPLMLVAYPLASLRGYRRNPFERAARRRAGEPD